MANNPNRVSGRARIKINGAPVPVAGDVTLDIGGPSREAVNGDYDIGGYRETTKESRLEFSVLDKSAFSPSAFAALVNETVAVEFDNGRSFVIRNAWSEGAPQLTTSDGKAKCVMMGPPASEVK